LWDGALHEKSGAFATLAQFETVLQLVVAGGAILDATAKVALDWHSTGISALPLFPE
jgi:hypothetical protein